MAKKRTPAGTYIAATGLTNDKSGTSWQAGDIVQAGDFPAEVIAEWLEQKILRPADEEASNGSNGN